MGLGWRGVSEWTSIYVLQDFVVQQAGGHRDSCFLVVFWQYIMETGSPGLRRLLCDYFIGFVHLLASIIGLASDESW